ncbi:TPA: DNA-binding response regulator, partial [Streptococcus suis]|nr:DNA-binding response regulator [Streptococcus suis]
MTCPRSLVCLLNRNVRKCMMIKILLVEDDLSLSNSVFDFL